MNQVLRSIRNKLIMMMVGTNTFLVAVMILYISYSNNEVSKISLLHELDQERNLSQNFFDMTIQREADHSRILVSNLHMSHLLQEDNTSGVRGFLKEELKVLDCDQILIFDKEGRLLGETSVLPIPAKELMSKSFVQESIASRKEKSALLYQNGTIYYYSAMPLFEDGSLEAVAIVTKAMDVHFLQKLSCDASIDYALLYGSNVISSTFGKQERLLKTIMLSKEQRQWLCAHPSQNLNMKIEGEDYYASFSCIGMDESSTPFVLMVGMKDRSLYTVFNQAFFKIMMLFLIALMFSSIIAMYLSNKIHNILTKFIFYTQQIKQGDYRTKIEIETGDEFETLAQNLESMRESIYKQERTLQDYAANLEKKVEERTRKLNIQYGLLERIFDLQDEMIIVIKDAKITYANRSCLNYCGFSDLEEFEQKRKIYDVFDLPDEKSLQRLLENGGPFPTELDIKDSEGKSAHFEIKFYPIMEESNGYMVIFNDITLHKKEKERLYLQATTDALTHLSNRYDFEHKFQNILKQIVRNQNSALFCIMDIDDFKKVNDTYGHEAGDKVLKRVSELLMYNIRASDLLARWGGEEFVIVYYPITLENGYNRLETIRKKIEKENDDGLPHITCSFGATLVQSDSNMHEVFALADKALYTAKREGKNCVRFL